MTQYTRAHTHIYIHFWEWWIQLHLIQPCFKFDCLQLTIRPQMVASVSAFHSPVQSVLVNGAANMGGGLWGCSAQKWMLHGLSTPSSSQARSFTELLAGFASFPENTDGQILGCLERGAE